MIFDLCCWTPGAACTVLLIYMFCTDCWLIAAIYTTWLIVDWNTPKRGKFKDATQHAVLPDFDPQVR